jgi:hypothetical protein
MSVESGPEHVGFPVGPDAPVNLLPIGDLFANRSHLAGSSCSCGPTVESVRLGGGKVGTVVIHHAKDE